ncbi:MAG: hypothetical protein ACWGSQ_02490 [Longimicrobiales bacterium]
MIGRIPLWLLAVGIVIVASGCDNVSWGGVEFSLESPGADTAVAQQDTAELEAPPDTLVSLGPLLYAGTRTGNRVRVVPVAEITQAGLQPLPGGQEGMEANDQILQGRFRPGTELILFSQGVRVGVLVLDQGGIVADTYCQARPEAAGQLLLSPDAAAAERFLALESPRGSRHPFEPYQELASTYDQRVASLNLGAEAIPLVGATWPPSLLEIRQDLQILDLQGGDPAVLATFVHRDRLQVGPAPEEAYALMILGEPRGVGFELAYTWYRPVGGEGKGVPRYFSRMDWDGDGHEEILLEVLGADTRWFAALDRGLDGWQTIYQDPCGTPGAQGGEG